MSSLAEVRGVITRLRNLGVQLPADLVLAHDQLVGLTNGTLPRKVAPPARLIGLTDEELEAALEAVTLGIIVSRDDIGIAAQRMLAGALADAIAAELGSVAEAALDQLRPSFDQAAAVVHHATTLGITPATEDTDVLRLDDVAAARDAWTALPAAARMLDAIAAARIGLSRVGGVPPAEAPAGVDPQYVKHESARDLAPFMFRTDGLPWRGDFEDVWQLWVRLCTGSPARLLTLEESMRVARGVAA